MLLLLLCMARCYSALPILTPCSTDPAVQAGWGSPAYRITLLLPPREALLRCWADTDSLFECIGNWSAQPIRLRHPFCFYYGHTAAFTKLKLLAQVGWLFASGRDCSGI